MSQVHTLTIPNISCHHCVMAIKRETSEVPGVISVEGDASARTATFVVDDDSALAKVKAVLEEIGYPAQA